MTNKMEECHYFDDLVSKQRTVSVPTLDSTDPLEGVLRQVFIVRTGPNHRALMFLKLGRNCCQEKTNPRYCRVFFYFSVGGNSLPPLPAVNRSYCPFCFERNELSESLLSALPFNILSPSLSWASLVGTRQQRWTPL